MKVNGQLRRWYEPLAPPNVISDHIPDLAGVFHADHHSSGDPDSPIDVETHHALVALVIFAVAFVFNMNAAMWSAQNNRCRPVSYTHLPSPRDLSTSRMPSSA